MNEVNTETKSGRCVVENPSLNTEMNYLRFKVNESDSGTLTFLIGLSFYF
jgi:hypothetical protein